MQVKRQKTCGRELFLNFFYCYDAPMLLSGVLVVGIFQSSVVVSFVVAGTVVVIGKLLPIFRFQVLYQIIVDAELREQFKLLGFRPAHPFHKFLQRLAAALPVVEPPNLEHAPERRFVGNRPVDFTGAFQSCPLCHAEASVFPRVGPLEGNGFRILCIAFPCFPHAAAENGRVEIDNRNAFSRKSHVAAAGFDFHHRLHGSDVNAEFFRHMPVVLLGQPLDMVGVNVGKVGDMYHK